MARVGGDLLDAGDGHGDELVQGQPHHRLGHHVGAVLLVGVG
jgi:hypothetical protein